VCSRSGCAFYEVHPLHCFKGGVGGLSVVRAFCTEFSSSQRRCDTCGAQFRQSQRHRGPSDVWQTGCADGLAGDVGSAAPRARSTQPVCAVPLAHKGRKTARCKRSDNCQGGFAHASPLMSLQRANHGLGDQSEDGKRELAVFAVRSCDVAPIGLMQTKLPRGLALFCLKLFLQPQAADISSQIGRFWALRLLCCIFIQWLGAEHWPWALRQPQFPWMSD